MRRHACDQRWEQLVRKVAQKRSGGLPIGQQPTWCTLPREAFAPVVRMIDPRHPENILLTWQGSLGAHSLSVPASASRTGPSLLGSSAAKEHAE